MSSKIRKLTLSYPFKIEERHQRTVFSLDDGTKHNSMKIAAIIECYDNYSKKVFYKICTENDGHIKLWKSIYPEGCTIEIEYFLS